VIEKLWRQGQLVIARRDNFERSFDLAERHLPPELVALRHAPLSELPDEADEHAFKVRKRLRARRLFRRPNANDLAAIGSNAIVPVQIAGVPRPWYALAEDIDRLGDADNLPAPPDDEVNLLAPLDPLVYDRERNRQLFGFDYTWEVYTPEAKRRWGYYVLPVLWGDRLVARVDPRMDRRAGTLTLRAVHVEPDVDESGLVPLLAARLRAYATFLGAGRIVVAPGSPFANRLRRTLDDENGDEKKSGDAV
jgi:uncharacterized protein YcaQ